METKKAFIHPYIPNSNPVTKEKMLRETGAKNIDEFYEDIPEDLRFRGKMNIPEPILSEYELRKHVEKILFKNKTCSQYVNFIGGGCYQHFVPAICDEINQRAELLTAYAGEPYEDHGRFQTLFEYESLVAELVDMDVVNVPAIDGGQAAATSIRMASRMTGRKEVLIAKTINPDRLLIIKNYCSPDITVKLVDYEAGTGLMDISKLTAMISEKTAAVYFENPSYLGSLEEKSRNISEIAHANGAECTVGVDPITLGVLEAPANYGADIVCGDLQTLGIHMNYGGGQAGFIATRDEERYVMEYPSRLFGIAPTETPGEYGFGDVAYDRTSFALREGGKEYVGTQSALWGITAGVYLSLIGPKGLFELGQTIMQKSQYAVKKLNAIKNVKAARLGSCFFKEFIVDFSDTGKSVEDINKQLLKQGIFGGIDLTKKFPELSECALYCITEIHTREDIDNLVKAIELALYGKEGRQ